MSMARAQAESLRKGLDSVRPVMAKADINNVDPAGDLTEEQAHLLVGALVTAVLDETKDPLKEYGNPAQVWRWKNGQDNPNLARLLQKAKGRLAMAKALLRSIPRTTERTVFTIEEAV